MNNRIRFAIIIGVLVTGGAIGVSLFYLYPDMMFSGTGFEEAQNRFMQHTQVVTDTSKLLTARITTSDG